VSGTVVLPNWLAGTGHVSIYADEQGGPIDKVLSPSATIAIVPSNTEPNPKTYHWTIAFSGSVLPDPSSGSQIYRLLAKFMYEVPGDRHRRVRRGGRLPRQLSRTRRALRATEGAGRRVTTGSTDCRPAALAPRVRPRTRVTISS